MTTLPTTGPAIEPLRFAYWVPNVSGGLVTSTIEQRTDWSFGYNRTLARLAERAGFDYALSQVRYTASYGAEFQHESTKPLSWPGRPHPEIFQGGNSSAARRNGGQLSDWYFSNGKDFDGVREQLADLRQIAAAAGRDGGPRFGLNGFVIVRDTEREARDTLREIIAKAHVEAVEGFGAAVQQAGASTADKKGLWADSSFEDLVQYNDGFRTQLIGTPEQVAARIVEYRKLGVDLILTGFLHYHEEIERFGRDVLPIVRALEVEAGLGPAVLRGHPGRLGGHGRGRPAHDPPFRPARHPGACGRGTARLRGRDAGGGGPRAPRRRGGGPRLDRGRGGQGVRQRRRRRGGQ